MKQQETVDLPLITGGREIELYPKLLKRSNGELGFLISDLAPLFGIPEKELTDSITMFVESLIATNLEKVPCANIEFVTNGEFLHYHLSGKKVEVKQKEIFISPSTTTTLQHAILDYYRLQLKATTKDLESKDVVVNAINLTSGIQNIFENANLFYDAFKQPRCICKRIKDFFGGIFGKKCSFMLFIMLMCLSIGSQMAWAGVC